DLERKTACFVAHPACRFAASLPRVQNLFPDRNSQLPSASTAVPAKRYEKYARRFVVRRRQPIRIPGSLPLVLAFADPLQDLEARLLGVGNRKRLQLRRRMKGREGLAHRLPARGALSQRRGPQRPAQRESAAAYLALALAQFVFVNRHITINQCPKINLKECGAASRSGGFAEPEPLSLRAHWNHERWGETPSSPDLP